MKLVYILIYMHIYICMYIYMHIHIYGDSKYIDNNGEGKIRREKRGGGGRRTWSKRGCMI